MTDGTALEWRYSQKLSGMRGKWTVACKVKIVGKAGKLAGALKEAHLPLDSVPFVLRVPADESLAL